MTKIQAINDWLRKYPNIRKKFIHVIYFTEYCLYTIKDAVQGKKHGILTEGIRLTPANKNCFFGYYDKTPFDETGDNFLYHEINKNTCPKKGEHADLYIQNLKNGKRRHLGHTLAWNLQQGSMLRFIDNDTVAWNDYIDGNYCCIFYNMDSSTKKVLHEPLYDVVMNKDIGLTLDFTRLNVDAEGYGYIQEDHSVFSQDTYIKKINIKTGESTTIITIQQLLIQFPIDQKDVCFHYFNHLNANPSGDRFLFIHRYVKDGKRISRLFSSNLLGSEIHMLADDKLVSHFTWYNDSEILVWCSLNGKKSYYLIKDQTYVKYVQVDIGSCMCDGHPTFINEDVFVTDTYPDKACMRNLWVYSMNNKKLETIARLYTPIKTNGPMRCDLHPRIHPNKKSICIDSLHEGYRAMYLINID